MPELPEVETIRQDLLPRLVGRTFTGATVTWPNVVRAPSPNEFSRRLAGQRVCGLSRRGKYLVFCLESGLRLVVHLKLSGALLLREPATPPDRFTHTILFLDNGFELRFSDLRKFGRLWLVPDEAEATGALGPEPFDEAFSLEYMAQRLGKRSIPIKSALLDQSFVAGIGNIYADEALFAARIHPARPANTLDMDTLHHLRDAVRMALLKALGNRGTSFSDYRDPDGKEGRNQFAVAVFRQTGKPCPRCGTTIQRIKLGGRSSHFCPSCQPLGG